MKRIIICGVLTALIYPLVNFVNVWSGSSGLKITPQLVVLSIIASSITSIFFGKLLSLQGWKSERESRLQFIYVLLTSFGVMIAFALVMLFLLGSLMLMGAALPEFYMALVRALSSVAGISSFISMVTVLVLIPESPLKSQAALQK